MSCDGTPQGELQVKFYPTKENLEWLLNQEQSSSELINIALNLLRKQGEKDGTSIRSNRDCNTSHAETRTRWLTGWNDFARPIQVATRNAGSKN